MAGSITISRLLESTLKRDPNRIAIILGDKYYSYEELDTAANRIASRFQGGHLSGERMAFMLPNGYEILTTYLACFKSGAIAMPLNRRYAPPELHRVLKNAQAKWLIIESDKLALLTDLGLKEACVEKIFVVGQQNNTSLQILIHCWKDQSTLPLLNLLHNNLQSSSTPPVPPASRKA